MILENVRRIRGIIVRIINYALSSLSSFRPQLRSFIFLRSSLPFSLLLFLFYRRNIVETGGDTETLTSTANRWNRFGTSVLYGYRTRLHLFTGILGS